MNLKHSKPEAEGGRDRVLLLRFTSISQAETASRQPVGLGLLRSLVSI